MSLSEFISLHLSDDVRTLALQASRYPEIDMKEALRQIEARQKARHKLPRWAAMSELLFPVRLSMEQASSEQTALYKRQVVEQLISVPSDRHSFFDLTGGLGVDFSCIAPLFHSATYVEQNPELCRLAHHNMPLLGLPQAEIVCNEASTVLAQLPPTTLIFIDPARRSAAGGRTYAISDCQPDIIALLPQIVSRCQWFMVKLSPMLDLTATASALQPYLRELHVVEAEGECKEILAVCQSKPNEASVEVCCHSESCDIRLPMDCCGRASSHIIDAKDIAVGMYAYLPLKSLCKASCFAWLEEHYGVSSVARDSHVFLSVEKMDFPGRRFRIEAISSMNKRQLRTAFAQIKCANITVRNFPLSAERLRERLHLADGGDLYIIATTDREASSLLLVCRKASE